MTQPAIQPASVLELIAWGLDESSYRPHTLLPPSPATATKYAEPACTAAWQQALALILERPDLESEFAGLSWRVGLVDLRSVLAFQRRLVFNAGHQTNVPQPADLAALTAFAFPPIRPITHSRPAADTILTHNPDLTLRPSADGFSLNGGSPFIEVASYCSRLFLRDGYHRAYHLLRTGITVCPAVIIDAKTFVETGAAQPWFFSEDLLFSSRPPLLVDFHNPSLTLTYPRPPLKKTIRVHIEETFSFDA